MQKIKWSNKALAQLDYYIKWYEKNADIKIGNHFAETIQKDIIKIQMNPLIARVHKEIPRVREYIVQQYPFLIIYWLDKSRELIFVVTILHQKKQSNKSIILDTLSENKPLNK